ncbi:toprim domain-containing protein [Xylella fastidiosa subsp. multiplex]|nr:toprim domain-containing protein [Xylella fastidiosa]WDN62374.1 toprim domain-containing protein [Xylella fastidiosa subsp. multiplex]
MLSQPAPVIVIGEGYATVAQVSQALGYGTVVAFDAGNLEGVAKALHKSFPDKPILIAGDDDQSLPNNPGKTKAQEAARAVDGTAFFPISRQVNRRMIRKASPISMILPLRVRSVSKAVERQVHAAVSKAID